MSKRLYIIALLAFICTSAAAQMYPSYKISTYDTASKGYYFLCPVNNELGGKPIGPTQMILDDKGRVVYFKTFAEGTNTSDLKVWPNRLMSYSYNNQYYLMDSDFTIIDSIYIKNGYFPDLHDMQILPNGHFLLMGFEYETMDLSAYHYFSGNGSPGSKKAIVSCGLIQEQDANKNVVFEWHAKDHFAFDDVDSTDLSSPTNVDWTHMNAFAYDSDSNILVSERWFNEITKINHKTGAIIWRFGGKRNQFAFISDTNRFVGQHDIRRIANGDITLYDNGKGFPFHPATAREYKLDETNHTANLVWSYINNPESYSIAIGDVQRNPTGNTLIDYGVVVKENLLFNVLNQNGVKIFEINFDDSLVSYRSFNYPVLPWKLKRPQITCAFANGKYYLDAGAGYGKYIWSTGDTSRMIELPGPDTFSVFVPIGQGGFIRSEYFIASSHTDPCGLTAINEKTSGPGFKIFPNPVNEELIIQSSALAGKSMPVEIEDITGKKIFSVLITSFSGTTAIQVQALPQGMYIIDIDGKKNKFVKE